MAFAAAPPDVEAEERRIGAHRLCIEPPDICFIELFGDISGEESAQMVAVLNRLVVRRKIFLMVLMKHLGAISMEARRAGLELEAYLGAMAIVGASFSMKVIVTLAEKAFRFVRRDVPEPVWFFETEAEARSFFERRRREALGRGGSHGVG
jgi:hypothetical protein